MRRRLFYGRVERSLSLSLALYPFPGFLRSIFFFFPSSFSPSLRRGDGIEEISQWSADCLVCSGRMAFSVRPHDGIDGSFK